MRTHFSDVHPGDVVATNPKHGKGPLKITYQSTGPSGVTTLFGHHTDTLQEGKKRVPNDGYVDVLPPSVPAPPQIGPTEHKGNPLTSTKMFASDLTQKFGKRFSVHGGQRFDKIVYENAVYCFVERATGHVYKAATYKGPAPKVRYPDLASALAASDEFGSFLYDDRAPGIDENQPRDRNGKIIGLGDDIDDGDGWIGTVINISKDGKHLRVEYDDETKSVKETSNCELESRARTNA